VDNVGQSVTQQPRKLVMCLTIVIVYLAYTITISYNWSSVFASQEKLSFTRYIHIDINGCVYIRRLFLVAPKISLVFNCVM